jgi:hypothetical protein
MVLIIKWLLNTLVVEIGANCILCAHVAASCFVALIVFGGTFLTLSFLLCEEPWKVYRNGFLRCFQNFL